MEKYKSLFLWMIIPMVFMQLGISLDYWRDLSENTWAVHVHYWSATLWYGFLILQPWLATHGRLALHRTTGMIGFFLAGGVAIGGVSMLHRDIIYAEMASENPERFGPYTPEFFYGVAVIELLLGLLFGLAVFMAIVRRKQLEEHAWWLVSTVFIIMAPALGRGVQNVFILAQLDQWPDVDLAIPGILHQAIIVTLTLVFAWKYGKLKHPATILAVAINVLALFVYEIGAAAWVQSLLLAVIKG